jgi:hypothetical protein
MSPRLAMDRLIPVTIEHVAYPQQLPQALVVVVCSTFGHLEPSFVDDTDDPNAAVAIPTGELDSGHPSLEHRYWKVAL